VKIAVAISSSLLNFILSKKLGLDKPKISDIYILKKVCFPKRPLEFVSAAGPTINFRFKGMSKFKKAGEIISHAGKNFYKVGALISKTTNCFDKNINATKTKNISEVTLTDLQTGEKFKLVIGEKSSFKTAEAILVQIANNKEVLIKKGDKVPLNEKFIAEIENINVENQTVTFVLGSNTNVLEVFKKKEEAAPKKAEKKMVTLDFKDAPVVKVLNYLSDLKGDIVVYSPSVTNRKITVTYHKPVIPEEAKTIILKSLKLGNYILSIDPDKNGKQTITVEH